MANTTKVVFIGAGGMSFGLSVFRDLFSCTGLLGSTLMLVDIDADKLAYMVEFAQLMNAKSNAALKIESSTQWRDALPGASFVLNATVIDRNRLWKFDFDVQRKYGIRHTLDDNGGRDDCSLP